MKTEILEAARQAGDLCKVGQVYLFKSDKIGKVDVIERRMPEKEAIEKIKALDPVSLVSLGFEIAEKWTKDRQTELVLVRADEEGHVYPEDYSFDMIPSNDPYIAASEKKLSDKATVITEEIMDKAETAADLPIVYDGSTLAWRFKAVRQGVEKEYRCIIDLLTQYT